MTVGVNNKGEIISISTEQKDNGFRSKAVEDILLRQPDFLSRFALLFFVLILLVFLAAACLIRYTENISLSAVVLAENNQFDVVHDSGKLSAFAYINAGTLREIKPGRQVILNFPAYPSATVTGYIDTASAVKGSEEYLLRITLPYGLKTHSNRQLPYSPGLNATIQVNTETTSLLNYFLNKK